MIETPIRRVEPLSPEYQAILRHTVKWHAGPKGTPCTACKALGLPEAHPRPCGVLIAAVERLRLAGVEI